jgi:transposase
MRRYELTDAEWDALARYLPATLTGGRPHEDDRRVMNGIVWKIRSGAPWRDVPARYGSWTSVYARFRRWALDGTFTRMLAGAQAEAGATGDIDWLVSVDSTIVRARRHAAEADDGGSAKRPLRITPPDDAEAD